MVDLWAGCNGIALSLHIIISLALGGAAIWAFWRAFRPFGFLARSRSDIRKSVTYAAIALGLFALSGWVWMLGAQDYQYSS